MSKNVEINIKNENGYEILYPKTIPELTGCLPLSGGTMTGDLILNGNPTNNLGAVPKQYVDTNSLGTWELIYGQNSSSNLPNSSQYDTGINLGQYKMFCIKIITKQILAFSCNVFCLCNFLNQKNGVLLLSTGDSDPETHLYGITFLLPDGESGFTILRNCNGVYTTGFEEYTTTYQNTYIYFGMKHNYKKDEYKFRDYFSMFYIWGIK